MKENIWQLLIKYRNNILMALRKNQPLVFLSSVSIIVAGFLYTATSPLTNYFLVSFGSFLFATLLSIGIDMGIIKKEDWYFIFAFFFFLLVGIFSIIVGLIKALYLIQFENVPEVLFLVILVYIIFPLLFLLKTDYPALKTLATSYKRLRKIFKEKNVKVRRAIYLKMVLFFSFYVYIVAHLYIGMLILSLLKHPQLSQWEGIMFGVGIIVCMVCFNVTTRFLKQVHE